MNGQTVSLGSVLWKVLSNPLASSLTYDEAAEYAIEAIKLLGAPIVYDKKVSEVKITEYKGKLPENISYIQQVKDIETGKAMRVATDSFHRSPGEDVRELTYEVERGIIFTSYPEGCVEVSYKALPVDEEGYPLLVDNEKLRIALEYYILHRYLEPLWMMGKISDKAFQYVEQKRHFYMGSASNNLKMPSVDEMQSLVNTINRLIINDQAHENGFKISGKQEVIRKYRR